MQAKTYVALILWLGLFHVNVLALGLIAAFWPHPWAVAGLVLFVTLLFWPVHPDSTFGQKVARFVATNGPKYFPIKVSAPNVGLCLLHVDVLPVSSLVCPVSGLVPPMRHYH